MEYAFEGSRRLIAERTSLGNIVPGKWLLVALLVAFSGAAGDSKPAATQAAGSWLALVDAGKYAASWEQASAGFRKAIAREKWVEAVSSARDQVGAFDSRTLSLTQELKDPPNAPPGEYILLQYTSNFANKNDATETVVMALDPDKRWRTSGYFVK